MIAGHRTIWRPKPLLTRQQRISSVVCFAITASPRHVGRRRTVPLAACRAVPERSLRRRYSLAGVLRGSRCGLRSGPSLGRFRPGGAGVRRSVSRFRDDAGLSFDRLAMTYPFRPLVGCHWEFSAVVSGRSCLVTGPVDTLQGRLAFGRPSDRGLATRPEPRTGGSEGGTGTDRGLQDHLGSASPSRTLPSAGSRGRNKRGHVHG